MQWYDECLDSPIKEHGHLRDPPTSPPWRQKNSNRGFECDHDHDCGNGDLYVQDLDYGGRSARPIGGAGTMEGEGHDSCADVSGGGEGDDTAVLRSLEKDLAKQSAKQRRRPSKEHLDLLERGAALKTRLFGPQSSAARNALRDTIVACNSLAMSALGRGNTERCRDLLTRAFEIASARQMRGRSIGDKRHKHDDATDSGGGGDFVLQVLTLNNTACLHRRLGESKRALRCLRRAAELGRRSGGNEHLEVTHLNACAVLSELGRHEEALEHARSAVYYGQELEEVGTRAGVPERGGEAHLTSSSGAGSRSRRARLATLAISYYNLAVELEYTHRYEACLRWYNEAVKLARDPDVHNEELIKTFQRSYAEARKKHAPPYYQSSRLSGFRKISTAGEAIPTRIHEEETPDGESPSPSRVLRPLDVGAPLFSDAANAFGSPGSSSTANELGNGQRRRMLPEGAVADNARIQEHHRPADWPVFGRAERQRASDERRSHAWKYHNSGNNRSNKDAGPQNASLQSAALSPNRISRSDPLLQPQPYSRHLRDEALQVVKNTHNRRMGAAAWVRPASGSAAGRASSDPTIPPRLSRKRPASADIVTERDRRNLGRMRFDRVGEVPYEPAVAEPTRSQPQQLPSERCRVVTQPPMESPTRKSGPEMVVAAAAEGVRQEGRRSNEYSRRPNSACPRLEDRGGAPGGSLGLGTGTQGRRSSASSSRVGRIRSLSARSLKASASAPSPSTITLRNGWDGGCHKLREEGEGNDKCLAMTKGEEDCGRESEEAEAREEIGRTEGRDVVDGSSHLRQGRGDAMTTTTTTTSISTSTARQEPSRPHSDQGNASSNNDIGPSGSQKDHAVSSSVPATENDLLRRRNPTTSTTSQSSPSKITNLPTDATVATPQTASASARARKSTKRPVVSRSSPSRGRIGGSPRGNRQREPKTVNSKEHHRHRARDAHPDNGRDGKLYVDVDSDEEKSQKPGGTYLGSASNHNNVDPRFDNGRDGKLYVEPDNGRDGKLYGEPVDDEEQWTEESNGTRSLEAAPEINDAAANDTVRDREGLETYGIGTAEELRQENTAEASPPERFAGAAIVIQRAIAGAATRQRSSRHGGGAKGAGKALPEKYLLDPAGNSRRALSERESDGTKQKGERVSAADVATATLEVSASESVVQKRRKLAREAANRHVLAASTIRAWIARTCLARQLHRKKRARDDLKLRWEPEIQRIAATRIQAVARGVIGWRAWRRVQRAAVEIQRVERGWRGRAAANELSRTRLEEGRSSCETIQRVFRGHRGRQKAMRIRQIAWEETVARQGAAGVLQSAWHRRPNRRILQEPQQHTQRESTTTTTVGQAEKDDSASLAASSMTPTAGPERNLSTESSDAMPRQQLQRGAEAHGAVFAVWGAFNSLLATAATRCTVHRAVEQALLAPAAETLSIFNRNRGNGATTADLGSSTSLPSSPSRARIAALPPPDPVSFDCAPRFKRDMAVAVRRMAGTVLARASSLSGARAAVGILIGGASCGGEGGDFGSCSGVEDDESREGGRAAAEAVGDEAVALVLKVAEECWAFLSSSDSSPLAGLDDRVVSELLTEMLSDKLQGLIGNLGRICSPPSNLESIVLPVALVRALASSATASLLSHPDVAECVGLGRSEDGEEYDDGGVSLHPRGRNNLELGPIVSEVYCSFLSVLESGGCGTKNDQTREMNDAEEEPDAIGAPGRERKLSPFSPSPPSSSLVQIRTDERLQFLQSFAELIHGTAEELMSGMGTSGWHYDDAVSRMTSGLWEIARCGLIPCDADESREGGEENFSMSLPLTKQELQGGITGLGVDTVNPEDTPPASSGFLEITGNGGAADVLSPCPPPTGEGKKNPIDAPENGSSCSSRFTDARSVKEGIPGVSAIDDLPAVVEPSTGRKSAAEEPVATPRTLRVDACLPCSVVQS